MRWFQTLAIAISVTFGFPALSSAADAAKPSKDIDLVLCLDVSNSMDGLIGSAKTKLWDVVNELARFEPTPNLRVGLYSYGHSQYPQNQGWVRKDLDLSTDLDAVYAKLNSLRLQGGQELVARVTQATLIEQPWSKSPGAVKLIFVCGNEPVNQDSEVSLGEVAALARRNGVIVNTIYCGPANHREAKGWLDFAVEAGGKGTSIDQERGRSIALNITTPFDQELAELSSKLNSTYVALNHPTAQSAAQNQQAQDQAAAGAAPSAAAARGVAKASGLYRNSSWDLVDKLKANPNFDLKSLKVEELPVEIAELKAEERLPYLQKKAAERTEIQNKILELSKKRQSHIDSEIKKMPNVSGEQSLDDALKSMIRAQVEVKGFREPAKSK